MNGSSGRVEVCYNDSYGSVCDNGWGIINAGVVCRKLGFPFSSECWTKCDFASCMVNQTGVIVIRTAQSRS